jgi:hypothetical protein
MPPFARNDRKMYCEFHPRVHNFILTFEWAQEARVFQMHANDKHTRLFCPIVSYEENKFCKFQACFIFSL